MGISYNVTSTSYQYVYTISVCSLNYAFITLANIEMLRGLTFLVSELKAVLALSKWYTDIVLSTCWQERYTEIVISAI